jgi:hypothetical protein
VKGKALARAATRVTCTALAADVLSGLLLHGTWEAAAGHAAGGVLAATALGMWTVFTAWNLAGGREEKPPGPEPALPVPAQPYGQAIQVAMMMGAYSVNGVAWTATWTGPSRIVAEEELALAALRLANQRVTGSLRYLGPARLPRAGLPPGPGVPQPPCVRCGAPGAYRIAPGLLVSYCGECYGQ